MYEKTRHLHVIQFDMTQGSAPMSLMKAGPQMWSNWRKQDILLQEMPPPTTHLACNAE